MDCNCCVLLSLSYIISPFLLDFNVNDNHFHGYTHMCTQWTSYFSTKLRAQLKCNDQSFSYVQIQADNWYYLLGKTISIFPPSLSYMDNKLIGNILGKNSFISDFLENLVSHLFVIRLLCYSTRFCFLSHFHNNFFSLSLVICLSSTCFLFVASLFLL